jgi:hypothetical protein
MRVHIIYCSDRYDADDKAVAVVANEQLAKDALLLCPDPTRFQRYYYQPKEVYEDLKVPKNCRPYRCTVRDGAVVQTIILRYLENPLYQSVMGTTETFPEIGAVPPEQVAYCWATNAEQASRLALEMVHTASKDVFPST